MKKICFLLLACLIFFGCAEASPLFGTFADNAGNTIILKADGTYISEIKDGYGVSVRSEGNYLVIGNAITFTSSTGVVTVTEWDLRVSMLYLYWTNEDGDTKFLTLYKIAN